MQRLGKLSTDFGFSYGAGINLWGTIVGWTTTDAGEIAAMIWSKRSGMREVSTMFDATSPINVQNTQLTEARAINERGWIIALGYVLGSDLTRRNGYVLRPKFAGDDSACPAPPLTTTMQ